MLGLAAIKSCVLLRPIEGTQLTYTKEQRSTLCWIGITLTCVVVQVLISEIEIILFPVGNFLLCLSLT